MKLHQDFKDFLSLLTKHEVDYVLVGGYAVCYYGYNRNTSDIDFWVRPELSNGEKLVAMLSEFGFSGVDAKSFLNPDKLLRMGYPPVQIELFTSLDGLEFSECFSASTLVNVDGVELRIICLDHLKKNKKATGRPKDLLDLDQLL